MKGVTLLVKGDTPYLGGEGVAVGAYGRYATSATGGRTGCDAPCVPPREPEGRCVPGRRGPADVPEAPRTDGAALRMVVPGVLLDSEPQPPAPRDTEAEPRDRDAVVPWPLRPILRGSASVPGARVSAAVPVQAREGRR